MQVDHIKRFVDLLQMVADPLGIALLSLLQLFNSCKFLLLSISLASRPATLRATRGTRRQGACAFNMGELDPELEPRRGNTCVCVC